MLDQIAIMRTLFRLRQIMTMILLKGPNMDAVLSFGVGGRSCSN